MELAPFSSPEDESMVAGGSKGHFPPPLWMRTAMWFGRIHDRQADSLPNGAGRLSYAEPAAAGRGGRDHLVVQVIGSLRPDWRNYFSQRSRYWKANSSRSGVRPSQPKARSKREPLGRTRISERTSATRSPARPARSRASRRVNQRRCVASK